MRRFLARLIWLPIMAVVVIVAMLGGAMTSLAAQLIPLMQRVTDMTEGDE